MTAATAANSMEGEPAAVDARSNTQKLETLAEFNIERERGGRRVA